MGEQERSAGVRRTQNPARLMPKARWSPLSALSASPSSSDAQLSSRRLRVLVVDDEPDTVVSLVAILRDEGYEAKGIADARLALGEVETLHPDAVIVDLAMPHLSGWDIARAMRERPGKKPALIAISGLYVKPADQMLSRAAGFDHFLKKPCDPAFLLNILAAIPRH